jgi:hypothetical protein
MAITLSILIVAASTGCAGPTFASCTEFKKMGAAMNPACEDILAQGPPGYDQELSSQGGGGYGSPSPGSE